ncbi:MAG: group 1 truncated hemoglobin [Xanthomonadaceae bacterium]|jgi:hemoglobin|nr:group 1 truncated hemoglobin [Xanthomonadaceae bacterium]
MSRSSSAARVAAALLAVLLAACASTAPAPTLYQRLGGQAGIDALALDLLERSAADPRIRGDFAEADIVNLHERLVEQLCALSGGPCTYRGRDMRAAHLGLGITEADFNALVENLLDAMRARGLPVATQNELLALLAPMQREIVQP